MSPLEAAWRTVIIGVLLISGVLILIVPGLPSVADGWLILGSAAALCYPWGGRSR